MTDRIPDPVRQIADDFDPIYRSNYGRGGQFMEAFYWPDECPDHPYGYGLIDLLSVDTVNGGVAWSHVDEYVDWTVVPPDLYLGPSWVRCTEADVIVAIMDAREKADPEG